MSDADLLAPMVDGFVDAETLSERVDGFVALVRWTRLGWSAPEGEAGGNARVGDEYGRLEAVTSLLENAAERHRFQRAVAALFSESDGSLAFAHAGIPSDRGFLAEFGERVMNHLLPRPREDRDLGNLLRSLFRSEADVERLRRMPDKRFERLAQLLFSGEIPESVIGLRRSFADGFRLLGTWVLAQGLSPKLRKRSHPCEITDSPFYRIARASEAAVESWFAGHILVEEAESWHRECRRCRLEMAEIHRRIERDGVSTHVVYGLEVIERCLTRMSAMVEIMAAPKLVDSLSTVHRLLVELARSVHEDRSVRHLLWWNTHLLQRRIVERSGETGEHYITATRAEYRHMWIAAAGGGLLTVGTAALKTVISGWHTSDFAHGFLYGLNYAISFLLLQRLGLVLATKQPAMTAAALATIVRERRGDARSQEIADYAARIVRSQLAAVIGNVVVVSVGSVAFVYLWQFLLARPFLAESEAEAVYSQLSPFSSGTLFYAALTGGILWLATVVGGWFDNICAYHHVSVALAQHPAARHLGYARMKCWGESLARNAAGYATNVSLGFMLGMTPVIGDFLGLPLDVRHVTLSSGLLSLASASLGVRWFGDGMFLMGMAGVAVMFALNLGVSFMLALTNAVRAYEMPPAESRALIGALWRHFIDSPREFLLPPRTDPAGERHHGHT